MYITKVHAIIYCRVVYKTLQKCYQKPGISRQVQINKNKYFLENVSVGCRKLPK